MIKKIIFFVFSVVVFSQTYSSPIESLNPSKNYDINIDSSLFIKSNIDLNLDKTINIQDIIFIINSILGLESIVYEGDSLNGDFDGNNMLNILDVIKVVNNVLGLSNNSNLSYTGLINVDYRQNDLILLIYSEMDYSGIQLLINTPYNHTVLLKDNSHITLKENYINGQKIILAYSMFNDIFDGHKAEFTIKNGLNLSLEDIKVIVSDIYGNEIITNYIQKDINTDVVFDINSIYPNPFNPYTDIDFSLNEDSYVRLSVYNINGQEVDVIFEGYQDYGFHSYTWNASKFPSGIYYINLKSNDQLAIKKAMLIK